MEVLSGKNILLGITAGIAAYKTSFLVRLFIKAGANVKVIMTPDAKQFVTPLTLSTLSKNSVITDFTEEEGELWNNHVDLGLWADIMLVAPATANTVSKMANGQTDNFLLATYLSAKCPVYFAPAMDLDMYQHPTTKENFKKLEAYSNYMIPAESGELASGLSGKGRMAEPESIVNYICNSVKEKLPLHNKKFLITAGPTYEAIDPVRFIGNHSSGKMGFALAEEAAQLGAKVFLVSGPTALTAKNSNIEQINIVSTAEMLAAVEKHYHKVDVAIAAAAVSDYRPITKADQKIKKSESTLSLKLEKTEDILLAMGKKKKKQLLIGFALETQNEVENAKGKLEKKNLDFIVLNSLQDKGAGFKSDTNKIKIISKTKQLDFALKAKQEVAKDIISQVLENLD